MALAHGDGLIEEKWQAESMRSQSVFARTRSLLHAARIEADEIGTVVIDSGPGSYFGLRVAASFALGISHARHAACHGVTAGDTMAWRWFSEGGNGPLSILHDIRRGQIAAAVYIHAQEALVGNANYRVLSMEELPAACGDSRTVLSPDPDRLGPRTSPGRTIQLTAAYPDATWLARLAMARLSAGLPLKPASPLYLHPPVATSTAAAPV